jgi:hypothetical protein
MARFVSSFAQTVTVAGGHLLRLVMRRLIYLPNMLTLELSQSYKTERKNMPMGNF